MESTINVAKGRSTFSHAPRKSVVTIDVRVDLIGIPRGRDTGERRPCHLGFARRPLLSLQRRAARLALSPIERQLQRRIGKCIGLEPQNPVTVRMSGCDGFASRTRLLSVDAVGLSGADRRNGFPAIGRLQCAPTCTAARVLPPFDEATPTVEPRPTTESSQCRSRPPASPDAHPPRGLACCPQGIRYHCRWCCQGPESRYKHRSKERCRL